MEKEIAPIQTKYNGYYFRSRLEARWAVFFNAMNWKFEYEPEGFKVGNGQVYLPDFHISDIGYFEVKPNIHVDPVWLQKLERLHHLTGEPSILLLGPPDFRYYRQYDNNEGYGDGNWWSVAFHRRYLDYMAEYSPEVYKSFNADTFLRYEQEHPNDPKSLKQTNPELYEKVKHLSMFFMNKLTDVKQLITKDTDEIIPDHKVNSFFHPRYIAAVNKSRSARFA